MARSSRPIRLAWVARTPGTLTACQTKLPTEKEHSTLEFELRSVEHFDTRAQARARVSTWIQECNRDRRHSALDMMSPVSYEQALQGTEAP